MTFLRPFFTRCSAILQAPVLYASRMGENLTSGTGDGRRTVGERQEKVCFSHFARTLPTKYQWKKERNNQRPQGINRQVTRNGTLHLSYRCVAPQHADELSKYPYQMDQHQYIGTQDGRPVGRDTPFTDPEQDS